MSTETPLVPCGLCGLTRPPTPGTPAKRLRGAKLKTFKDVKAQLAQTYRKLCAGNPPVITAREANARVYVLMALADLIAVSEYAVKIDHIERAVADVRDVAGRAA